MVFATLWRDLSFGMKFAIVAESHRLYHIIYE
jgi:hypothetical protein